MTQAIFSAGAMYGTRTDESGIGPDQFGLLQNVSIDFNRDVKTLHGEGQFPALVATGMSTITGRAAHGRIFGAIYADLFFGETLDTGSFVVAQDESHTIPASPAYTVLADHMSNWTEDLGVYVAGTRLQYTTSGSPSSGQYTVSLGTYTFNAAQAGLAVKISYLYESGSGKMITINNQLMGVTPSFKLFLTNPGRTQAGTAPFSLWLTSCTASKLTFPLRIGEFSLSEFEFSGYADASDIIGYLSTTE